MSTPPKAPPGKAGSPPGKGGAGSGPLTKKLGPLPVWVWLAIVGVIIIGWSISKNGKAPKKTAQDGEQDANGYTQGGSDQYGLIGGDQRPPVVFESFQTQIQAPPFGGRPFPPSAPPPTGPCSPGAGQWITVAPWKKHGAPWNSTCRGMAKECYGDESQWQQIWNCPENSALRHRRKDCDHIQAGDRVWCPPLNQAGQACPPGGPGPQTPGPWGGAVPPPSAPGGIGVPPPPPPPMTGPQPPTNTTPPPMPGPSTPPGRGSGGRHSRSR
jgi:hypothetical protein